MSDDRTIIARRPTPPGQLPSGTRLNGIFEIETSIGAGGMGRVYRARNVDTGDTVAVKVVRPEMASNPQVIALFRKEAAVLNKLLHDAIVRYYLLTTDPVIELPYIVTEFVDGVPLSDVIEKGPLPLEDVLALGARLADGLRSAHSLEIIHRDISPDNILMPGGDVRRAKIIDFGIARASLLGAGTMIGDSIAGKFDYMSPEQVGLNASVDARSDIYSLGIVLAEAALGRSLEMGGSHYEVLRKRQEDPDLSAIEPRLRAVLADMLRPKSDDRLQSMTEVADRFRALMGAPSVAEAARRRRTSPFIAASIAAVVLAGGGAAAYVMFAPAATDPDVPVQNGDSFGIVTAEAPATTGTGVAAAGPELTPAGPAPSLTPPTEAAGDSVAGGLPSENAVRTSAGTTPASPAPAAPSQTSPAPAAPSQSVPAPAVTPASPGPGTAVAALEAQGGTPPASPPPAGQPATPDADPATPAAGAGNAPASAPETEVAAVASPAPGSSPDASSAPATPSGGPAAASGPTAPPQASAAADTPPSAAAASGPSGNVDVAAIAADSALNPVGRPEFGILRYVRQYDAGPCTLLRLKSFGPERADVVAFAEVPEPLSTFDTDFRQSFGFEATIEAGLVTREQCPIIDFLRRVGPGDDSSLRMQLDTNTVRPGGVLSGAITGLDARDAAIFLVDADGLVYGLNELISRGRNEATVHIKVAMDDRDVRPARPQLLVAVAGANVQPLSAQPVDAATAVRELEKALAASGTLETTVGYYRFGS